MKGYNFSKYDPTQNGKTRFEQLLDIFMQLLTYTNGDVGEAMQWMNELDKEYKMTGNDYGMGDFYEDLKDKGYIDEKKENGEIKITPKTERSVRHRRWNVHGGIQVSTDRNSRCTTGSTSRTRHQHNVDP